MKKYFFQVENRSVNRRKAILAQGTHRCYGKVAGLFASRQVGLLGVWKVNRGRIQSVRSWGTGSEVDMWEPRKFAESAKT